MSKKFKGIAFVLLCTAVLAVAAPASAGVVGYWRMEDGANLGADSSGNNLTLTVAGLSQAANTGFPAAVAGAGVASGGSDGGSYMKANDSAAFAPGDFTIEAFANLNSADFTWAVIAGQQQNDDGNRSWQLFRDNGVLGFLNTGHLYMTLSANGAGNNFVDSGFSIETNHNYYVAAAVDFGAASTDVTFYLKDYTAGTELQTSTVTVAGLTSRYDNNTPFRIGAQGNGGDVNNWIGQLDEVRLSDATLSQGDLLVPEPATLSLIVLGGLAVLRRARRR